MVEDPQIAALTADSPWGYRLIASRAIPDTHHRCPTDHIVREHFGAPLIRQHACPSPPREGCPCSEHGSLEQAPISRSRGVMLVVDHIRVEKDPQYQGDGAREPFGRIDPSRAP